MVRSSPRISIDAPPHWGGNDSSNTSHRRTTSPLATRRPLTDRLPEADVGARTLEGVLLLAASVSTLFVLTLSQDRRRRLTESR